VERLRGRPTGRPRSLFWWLLTGVALAGLFARPVGGQEVPGWRVHPQGSFLIYTVDGTPGARDVVDIAAQLSDLHARSLAPLHLPPTTIQYPLYPSVERFQTDWWQFAVLASGDVIYGWGTVYDGRSGRVSPYVVTRAMVAHAFPRAIPLLKWGLGDALGDRVIGIDSHRGVRVLLEGGVPIPMIEAIVAPFGFGEALPASYPVAVSFVAFLLDDYGLARTAAFVDTVAARYYDFAPIFEAHFGSPLAAAEQRWRQRLNHGDAVGVDPQTYLRDLQIVTRTTLAANPSRTMLRPGGAVIVWEAFQAIMPLRAMDLRAAETHLEAIRVAETRATEDTRRTALAVRGGFWVVVLAPIALAIGWLMWPSVRARLAERSRRDRR